MSSTSEQASSARSTDKVVRIMGGKYTLINEKSLVKLATTSVASDSRNKCPGINASFEPFLEHGHGVMLLSEAWMSEPTISS